MITLLRDLVFKDFWLKLFSLGLAVLVWFTVTAIRNDGSPASSSLALAPTEEMVVPDLPVVIMSSAADVRSFKVNPAEVEVTVRGERRMLQKLQPKDIHVMVDLTGIEAAHELRKRLEVSTPAGVTHVRVSPEEVQVIFPPKN